MNRRGSHHKPSQPDLFASLGHNSGGEKRSREDKRLYTSILYLRIYCREAVYRVGREHLVAGHQLSTHQLYERAAAHASVFRRGGELPDYVLVRLGMK